MQNNINLIISKALKVDKDNLKNCIKDVIFQMKQAILSSEDIILEANKIDVENNNGFLIDFKVIRNIFDNLERENIFYGDVCLFQKDSLKNLVYGTQIMECGNVVVLSDGNPYITIEMIFRCVMAGNTTIFVNDGFMYGTNGVLVNLIQGVLEGFKISKEMVQIYVSETFDEVFKNYANIDLMVGIGNHNFQGMVLKRSRVKTIVSGYEHFDLYIDEVVDLKLLEKIINTGLDIQLYINKKVELDYKNGALDYENGALDYKNDTLNYGNGTLDYQNDVLNYGNINLDYQNAILVDDVDEAIGIINYNGSKYSAAIFTKSKFNAEKFVKEVKSKKIVVNTSPTIERILDLSQRDLVNEKTIIYPVTFKLDGTRDTININELV